MTGSLRKGVRVTPPHQDGSSSLLRRCRMAPLFTINERLPITAGPSKWDWALSLMDGNSDHRRSISFEVSKTESALSLMPAMQKQGTHTVHVFINMIAREDNSGGSWLFEGCTVVAGDRTEVHGYYSTKNRTGWIELKA